MSKIKLRFFTIADYEEEEIWLREQHKKGLRLVKILPPCFFIFEECVPEDVLYRLDYKNNCETGDYLQLFQDYGWEYVSSCVGWLYFRKPAADVQSENDGEIFSERESRVDMIWHIIKTRMMPLFVIFLCCVIPNWMKTLHGTFGFVDVFFGIFFTVLLMLYLYLLIYCGQKLVKLRKKYEYE